MVNLNWAEFRLYDILTQPHSHECRGDNTYSCGRCAAMETARRIIECCSEISSHNGCEDIIGYKYIEKLVRSFSIVGLLI